MAFALGALAALWLGIWTSLMPCPLATNIAAVSFVGRRAGRTAHVLLSGLLYMSGRMITYAVLGILILLSVRSSSAVSLFLQRHMNELLGPILILVGMFLLGLVSVGRPGGNMSDQMQRRIERLGVWGAGALGMLFALSFCPPAAGLFFGSLIPLAIKHGSVLLYPLVYGMGTALPVLLFTVLLVLGAQWVGRTYNVLAAIEKWMRRVTGVLIIIIGMYYCLIYIFEVL